MAVKIAALFQPKARAFIAGRKGLIEKLQFDFSKNTHPVAWFHCASLGEFEQGRPIIEAFKVINPKYKILLTFFSPSGYEVRKGYSEADFIYYLPTDSKSNAHRFIETTAPSIAFFIKYEFWHFYSKALHNKGIPLISTSSIFRENQIYFRSMGSFYRDILKNFTHFFVQDHKSKELLATIGIENVSIAGDTRFDRVKAICDNKKPVPGIKEFKSDQKLMVIGSCWPEDLEVLVPFINAQPLKFIIAPHEINEKFMIKIETDLIKSCLRYSQRDGTNISEFDVLIIDNIGMLSSLYAYGDYAFVGGAFGQGLHNILEPTTFGLPVFFGNKNYQKFREARDLINLGGAFVVRNYDDLRNEFNKLSEEQVYNIAKQVNIDYISNNIGATGKILGYCQSLIQKR